MTNPTTNVVVAAPGPDLFLDAAMIFARDYLEQKGGIPTVMILGRYADEEMLFVFPSSQEREDFKRSCVAQAAEFGANVAIMVDESTLDDGDGGETEVVALHWRERGQPTRAQFAPMHRIQQEVHVGPTSSLPGEHHNEFTDAIFGSTLQ